MTVNIQQSVLESKTKNPDKIDNKGCNPTELSMNLSNWPDLLIKACKSSVKMLSL